MEERIAVVVEAMVVPACLCGQPAPPVILLVAVLDVAALALQLVTMAVMLMATTTVVTQSLRMLATLFLDPVALLLARDAVVAAIAPCLAIVAPVAACLALASFGNHLRLRAAGLGQLALPILGLPPTIALLGNPLPLLQPAVPRRGHA